MNLISLVLFVVSAASLFAVDFVLFTQPKTGTHLLCPILSELTGKTGYCPRDYVKQNSSTSAGHHCKIVEGSYCCPNEIFREIWQTSIDQEAFLHFHTPYTPEMENYLIQKGAVVFFVKRDPRDQIVSLLNHYKKFRFLDKEVEKIASDDERLFFMINHRMKSNFLLFKGWLSSPICCVLDFSKLMGSHGGAATDEDAIGEIRKMADVLQVQVTDEQLKEIYEKHFGKANAFFRGKVSSWRDYFSARHKIAAKKEIGHLLVEWGFEKDLNW